jgi:A/G-specific adenine glycosylase
VNPSCLTCPLQQGCHAFATGRVELLPVKKEAAKPVERHLAYVYVRFLGQTAIHRRGPGDIWQGLWEPLLVETVPEGARLIVKGFRHQLTHRTLYADFWLWAPADRPALPDGYSWIEETELDRYAKPRLFERLLDRYKAEYSLPSNDL